MASATTSLKAPAQELLLAGSGLFLEEIRLHPVSVRERHDAYLDRLGQRRLEPADYAALDIVELAGKSLRRLLHHNTPLMENRLT